jgi:competence protein ComEA
LKNFLKSYLLFSKRERIGLLVVFILLVFFLYLPQLFKPNIPLLQTGDTTWLKEVEYQESNKEPTTQAVSEVQYFYFDPNTANAEQLQSLGLTPTNVQTILRYRNKGGQFRNADDILKIWGIASGRAKALIPYIRIPAKKNMQSIYNGGYNPPYTPKKIPIVEINIATASEWEALPGIGHVLAARIVKYRDKIGGFAEIDEIKSVYGIRDSLINALRPFLLLKNPAKPSINHASEAILKKAGVPPSIAAAIVQFRNQYGFFESLNDLRKIVFIRDVEYELLLTLVTL